MDFRLICAGVNVGPDAAPLSFAEKDASDIATLFASGIGPVTNDQVDLLQGSAADRSSLRAAFLRATLANLDVLVFYFSGHGNEHGLLTSSGILEYEEVIRWIRAVDAPRSIVILDVCRAASYLDFLKEAHYGGVGDLGLAWFEAIANATPGTRLLFSTAASRNAGEGGGIENGHFTFALIEALRRGRGDLAVSGRLWISDQRAFNLARFVLEHELGVTNQCPVERGLTGDLPIALSQADQPIGGAYIGQASVVTGPGDLALNFSLWGRAGLTTRVVARAVNQRGCTFWQTDYMVTPDDTMNNWSGRIPFPRSALRGDTVSRVSIASTRRTEWSWVLSIFDTQGRLLDDKVVHAVWHQY
jgi:hypothetical protein